MIRWSWIAQANLVGFYSVRTKTGSVAKFVTCEGCGYEYVYILSRKSIGKALSIYALHNQEASNRSQRNADLHLQRLLAKSCDPVPCPQCGWYQESMVRRARKL